MRLTSMTSPSIPGQVVRWSAAGAALAGAAYAAYAGITWFRYGRPARPDADDRDDLLDRFMPAYDIVERHHIHVEAPAAVTLAAACEMRMLDVPVVRAIFGARALILGSAPDDQPRPRGMLDEMRSRGWVVLADTPGREIVCGAAARPWEANVVFRPVAPDRFLAFDEPEYVKIAWTLRADPDGPTASIFRTETRAVATDASARGKFRRYWALLSPGILLIRRLMLPAVRTDAERRARAAGHGPAAHPSAAGAPSHAR